MWATCERLTVYGAARPAHTDLALAAAFASPYVTVVHVRHPVYGNCPLAAMPPSTCACPAPPHCPGQCGLVAGAVMGSDRLGEAVELDQYGALIYAGVND